MEVVSNNFMPGDPRLIDQIVYELKSQGIFDQFRKECISDVDTKPAYQNLRQRVEGSVMNFLKQQTWRPDMNKNQVREMLRKNIHESGYLETGVERIVDQVVNPKITSVFLPKVEEVVYRFLGIELPNKDGDREPAKIVMQDDLLPTDLEAVSPESSITDKKDESMMDDSVNLDDSKVEEDESPPFEPLDGESSYVPQEENSVDSHMSGFSGLASHDSNHSLDKTIQMDCTNQDSHISQNSSESRLSIVTSEENTRMEQCDESNQSKITNNESNNATDSSDIVSSSDMVKKTEEKSKSDSSKHRSDDRKSRSSLDKSKSKDKRDDKDRKSSSSKDKDYKSRHSSSSKDKDKSKDRKDYKSSSSSTKEKTDVKDKSKISTSRSSSSKHTSSKDKSSSKPSTSSSSKSRSSSSHKSSDKSRVSSSDRNKKDDKSSSSRHSSSGSSSKKDKDKKRDSKKDKDDHYSSKDKKSDRRSTDRDSNDGQSGKQSSSTSTNGAQSSQSQKSSQDSTESTNGNGSGDSGNSDQCEQVKKVNLSGYLAGNEIVIASQEAVPKVKLYKPKFASNIYEAKRLMKIRKQIAKLEKQNQLGLVSIEPVQAEVLSVQNGKEPDVVEEEPILQSKEISRENWEALEARLYEEMSNINYNSYESPDDDYDVMVLKSPAKQAVVTACEIKNNVEKEDEVIETMECTDPVEVQSEELTVASDDCKYFEKPGTMETNKQVWLNAYIKKLESDIEQKLNQHKNNNNLKIDIANLGRKRKFEDLANNNQGKENYEDGKKLKNTQLTKTTEITSNDNFPLPLSPADSEPNDKKEDLNEPPTKLRRKAAQKNTSQRYSSDDLYKPRPMWASSRRRGAKNKDD